MTAHEAAVYLTDRGLTCTPRSVLRWAKDGKVRCRRTPGPKGRGRVSFTADGLEAFLLALESGPTSPSPVRLKPARPRRDRLAAPRLRTMRDELEALRRL